MADNNRRNRPSSGYGSNDNMIFREKRRKEDILIAGAGQPIEHAAKRRRCANGQIQLVRRVLLPKATVQGIRDPLPCAGIAGCAGIAVDGIRLLLQQLNGSVVHFCRSGYAGVTQRKVKHVLRADLGRPLTAVFKQLPDHGTGRTQPQHPLRNHRHAS